VPLKIIGDGPQAELVRKAVAADSRIEWLGRRSSEEVLQQMSRASMLVIPSICYEACPKSLIESFAVGTPVVASRLGSMIDRIRDGQTGWHFDPGEATELASCIDRIWRTRHQLKSHRQAAREEFEQKYTAQRNYEALMEIYQSVMRSSPARDQEVLHNEPLLTT
jgi:glycosyltransferase involved in cell wall biosynthesis